MFRSKFFLLLCFTILIGFILRFYHVETNPPSLYWDEASLGYNAYSIATSGRDEHGEFLPLARFIAYGDYKPPGYIYAIVPFIYILGLTELAVRLPSVFAGTLMILFIYLLSKELFRNSKIALASSLVLAISPWSIQLSRAAFEANLAALFNLSAIYFFIASRKRSWYMLLSFVLFVLSFYTFNANRIIAPLLLFALSLIYIRDVRNNLRWYIISALISFLLVLPSIGFLQSSESKLRFQEVSIFNELVPIQTSNERMEIDQNTPTSRILHNRRVVFSGLFLKHYFDNFTGRFLFTHGDVNPRLSVQEMGELYVWDAIFLLGGIYLVVKGRKKAALVLLFWALISPIPAATARETPHALRIESILPVYHILIACGIYGAYHYIEAYGSKIRLAGVSVGVIVLVVNIFYYLHTFYVHYPSQWSGEWQYGYKDMVKYVSDRADKYEHIYITESLGRPYIYFAFYMKYPQSDFYRDRVASRDWFGFWEVESLGKIKFGLDRAENQQGATLLVTHDRLPDNFKQLSTVQNLAGDTVFTIGEKL